MLYSRNLEQHMMKTLEEIGSADSMYFNARVKEFFGDDLDEAKHKLCLITLASKMYVEAIFVNHNRDPEDSIMYSVLKEYINKYLNGINVYSFHKSHCEERGLFGYTLIVNFDDLKDAFYRFNSKFYYKDMTMPDVETILESLIKYTEEGHQNETTRGDC